MKSPFKFLKAYDSNDRDYFFGREEEIEELYDMVKRNRLVVVYGQSGTGKTSLVQCGLAGRFESCDWFPQFIRRENDINAELLKALQSAAPHAGSSDAGKLLEEIYLDRMRPVYLIFDQLEELLILGDRAEKKRFAETIAQIYKLDLPCRILFILREEYYTRLYEFESSIPTLFNRRLRVENMNPGKLTDVILKSCEKFNITLEDDDYNAEQIIENLSLTKTEMQLPYLQVYLDTLWQETCQQTYGDSTPEDPSKYPPIQFTTAGIDELGDISNMLSRFLDEQELRIGRELSAKFPEAEPNTLNFVLDAFVTIEGTKKPIRFDKQNHLLFPEGKSGAQLELLRPDVLTFCIAQLELGRILTDRNGVYELAHDSLAKLIDSDRSDEARQLVVIQRRIQARYNPDYKAQNDYLSEIELNNYLMWLPKMNLDPTLKTYVKDSEQQVYAQKKQKEEQQARELALVQDKLIAEQKNARQMRIILILSGFFLVGSIWLYLNAELEKSKAEQAKNRTDQTLRDLNEAVEARKKAEAVNILSEVNSLMRSAALLEAKYPAIRDSLLVSAQKRLSTDPENPQIQTKIKEVNALLKIR
jgi:AAA ATPase domain